MTKEEARKSLQNTKVYVAGKSKKIQEKLFELGCRWSGGEKYIMETSAPFLFVSGVCITYSHDMEYFSDHDHKEISADDILNITLEEKPQFKPFDRVLVRNSDEQQWHVAFYSHQDDGRFVINVGWHRNQCIPYEGNEKLVGTTNKPK